MGIGRQLHAFTYIAVFENHTITIADGEKFIDGKKFEYNAALNTYCSVIRNVVHDAAKLIQEAKIPEAYYNSENAGYAGNWIHSPPLLTGVANGAIEEIKDIPVLVTFGADVAMNPKTRSELWQGLKKINSWSKVKEAAQKSLKGWTDKYSNGGDQAWHQAGKDGVGIFNMAHTASTLVTTFKKGIEKNAGDISESVEKTQKELVDVTGEAVGKYDWWLVKRYFQHIQDVTGRAVNQKQIDKLKDALRAKEYKKLTEAETAIHRADFNARKNKIIKDWEMETGQEWPRYTESVYSKTGVELRKPGDLYDAHHIIENKFGGDNEWWNMHPAKFPDEHQGGIHGAGSPSRELFK